MSLNRLTVIACALILGPGAALAHPHAWIDISVTVQFDDQGRVSGLHQTWLFDEFYSIFATEGTDADGDGRPDQARLDELMRGNMNNLAEFDYFTEISLGDRPLTIGGVDEMATTMRGPRLEMSFYLSLAEPTTPADESLTYAIYDPTFYIEVLHIESNDAIALADAPSQCLHWLVPPNPDPSAATLAASLDRNQTAGDGLGILFAERVQVQCD